MLLSVRRLADWSMGALFELRLNLGSAGIDETGSLAGKRTSRRGGD